MTPVQSIGIALIAIGIVYAVLLFGWLRHRAARRAAAAEPPLPAGSAAPEPPLLAGSAADPPAQSPDSLHHPQEADVRPRDRHDPQHDKETP